MEQIKIWVSENLSWLGFLVMWVMGSIVAHLKAYESSSVEWTMRQHTWGLMRRLIYGTLAGLMVYQLHIEFKWSDPLSFVATGISAVFAADFFDFLWITAKAWARKKLGLDQPNGGSQ